jgi:hypothetical protein
LQLESIYNLNIFTCGVELLFSSDMTLKFALASVGTHEFIFIQKDIAKAPLFNNLSGGIDIGEELFVFKMDCEDVVSATLCFSCM